MPALGSRFMVALLVPLPLAPSSLKTKGERRRGNTLASNMKSGSDQGVCGVFHTDWHIQNHGQT